MSDLGDLFDQAMAEEAEAGDEGNQVDNPDVESTDDIEDQIETDDETIEDVDVSTETDDVDESDDSASWDWQEYQDQLIPVKVNGEEQLVTLKEWRDGYMRQADYTKGKQAIAEVEKDAQWARDFQVALNNDPQGTLEDIARAFGLLEQAAEETTQTNWNLDSLDEEVRPFAEAAMQANKQLAEMKQMFMQQEQSRTQAQQQERLVTEVRKELDSLREQYGGDLDPRAALKMAADYNMPLSEAAEVVVAKKIASATKLQSSTAKTAAERAAEKAEQDRQRNKKVASQKSKTFKASDIPADDFNDIGELMEQVMASQSS